MKDYIYLFDLDSTITKQEILPTISKYLGNYEEMKYLTEITMQGKMPFEESFIKRINLLKNIPVNVIRNLILDIELNTSIVKFIKDNKNKCYIITGNLDVWIEGLIKKIGMENRVFSSKAITKNNYIIDILNILNKGEIPDKLNNSIIAIGDGNNDLPIIKKAEIGIGFGGVREIAPSVLKYASYAIYSEKKLVNFLELLKNQEEVNEIIR